MTDPTIRVRPFALAGSRLPAPGARDLDRNFHIRLVSEGLLTLAAILSFALMGI